MCCCDFALKNECEYLIVSFSMYCILWLYCTVSALPYGKIEFF
jgi:hypothetical protein